MGRIIKRIQDDEINVFIIMYRNFLKRALDFIIAFSAFLVFLPFFMLLIILLNINNKGSAFFCQKRPGKNAKIFKVIKFKTMTDEKDEKGELLPDKDRLTKLGKFIRKTSLDELPQLINVIKGDMSLIGPRPLLPEYLKFYNNEQKKRHNVKPGITGWAQVNGRNAISWQKKFEYDVWYIDNLSFLLDVKILIKTVMKVIKSEGITSSNEATTTRFIGNN